VSLEDADVMWSIYYYYYYYTFLFLLLRAMLHDCFNILSGREREKGMGERKIFPILTHDLNSGSGFNYK
jgi:hypothetical protein